MARGVDYVEILRREMTGPVYWKWEVIRSEKGPPRKADPTTAS
jgi:hypothetical protein